MLVRRFALFAGLALSLTLGPLGCASDRGDDDAQQAHESGSSESALDTSRAPRLRFTSDFRVVTEGKVQSGRKIRVDYDDDRMPTCRGNVSGGKPGWTVTGHYRAGAGVSGSFTAAGRSPTGAIDSFIELPPAMGETDIEIWFENTNRWGCQAFDSNYGQNYRFIAAAPPEAPSWMGKVRYAATRYTCGNGACDSERRDLDSAFVYESWARQRAAVTELTFQVYEPGVTDWDDPDAWRKLDVKVHRRWRRAGSFSSSPVAIDHHVGNDLQYKLDVRPWDPFRGPGAFSQSDCPDADLERVGVLATATVEFYFSVNGVELRPAPGEVFRGKYQVVDQPWDRCLP